MALSHTRIGTRRALRRFTHHLAIWVVLGGVAGAAQCRRRPAGTPAMDLPRRTRFEPTVVQLGRSADRELVRHVVGL